MKPFARQGLAVLAFLAFTGCNPFSVTTTSGVSDRSLEIDGPVSAPVGACVRLTVSLTGTQTQSTDLVKVSLAATGVTAGFYADTDCKVQVSATTTEPGAKGVSIYFLATSPGTAEITATVAGVKPGTYSLTVDVADKSPGPTQIAFGLAPGSVEAGRCSNAFTVNATDDQGNIATAKNGDLAVSLTSSQSSGSFFSDTSCSSPIHGVTIPQGKSSATFYYLDTLAAKVTITASSQGLVGHATQVAVTATQAVKWLLAAASATTVTASTCVTATIAALDRFGNPVPAQAPIDVTFSGLGAGSLFSDASCGAAAPTGHYAIATGTTGGAFSFRDTKAESVTLTASGGGLSTSSSDAPLTIVVGPTAPYRIVATPASVSLVAQGCSPAITFKPVDAFDNTSPVVTPVDILPASGQGTFYLDDRCGTPLAKVTLPAGALSVKAYYGNSAAGTWSPVGSLSNGSLGVPSLTATVSAGSFSQLVFYRAPQSTLTAGACSNDIVVRATDAAGNRAPVTAATALTFLKPASGSVYLNSGCQGTPSDTQTIAIGASDLTISYRDTVANPSATMRASISASLQTPAAPFSIQPDVPVTLTLSAPSAINAGQCSPNFVITGKDKFGNVAPFPSGTVASLTGTGAGNFFFFTTSDCSGTPTTSAAIGDKSVIALYGKLDLAGTYDLSASAVVGTGVLTSSQQVVGNQGPPAKIRASLYAVNTTAGKCSQAFTVYSTDASGVNLAAVNNPLGTGVALGITTTQDSDRGKFYGDKDCTVSPSIPNGQSSAIVYFRGTAPSGTRTATILANVASSGTASTTIDFTMDPGPFAQLIPGKSSSTTIKAGECPTSALHVDVADEFGNPTTVPSIKTLTFSNMGSATASRLAGCQPSTTTFTLSTGAGGQDFWVLDSKKEGLTIKMNLTDPVTGAQQASGDYPLNVIAAAPASLGLTFPSAVDAGACKQGTVVVFDAFGNLTASDVAGGYSVALSESIGGGTSTKTFFSDSQCTDASATVTVTSSGTFYFKETTAGAASLQAKATNSSIGKASLGITINAIAPSKIALAGSGSSEAKQDVCIAISGSLLDQYDNTSAAAATITLTPSITTSTVQFFSDGSCGTAAPGGTLTLSGSSPFFTFSLKDSAAESFKLNVDGTSGGTTLKRATQSIQIDSIAPAKLAFTQLVPGSGADLTSGICSVFKITTLDSGNNTTPVLANTTLNLQLSASGTSPGTFYEVDASNNCKTQPTQTFSIAAGGTTVNVGFVPFSAPAPQTKVSLTATPNVTVTNGASSYTVDSVSLVVNVNPGAPAKLSLTAANGTTSTVGTCSNAYVVSVRDVNGNPTTNSTGSPITVTPKSARGATDAFYGTGGAAAGSTCGGSAVSTVSIAANQSSASFYLQSNVSGTATLSASASGLTDSNTLAATLLAGPIAKVVYTSAPSGAAAGNLVGACVLVSVGFQDTYGNSATPGATGATAVFTNQRGTSAGGYFTTSSCSTSASTVSLAATASTASLYFKGLQSGSDQYKTVYTSPDGTTTLTATSNFTVDQPASLAFTATQVAAGTVVIQKTTTASNTFTATLKNTGSLTAQNLGLNGSLPQYYAFQGGTYPGTSGTCGGSLAAGASCTLSVTFTPTATTNGPVSFDLKMGYTDGVTSTTQIAKITVTGRGAVPFLDVDEDTVYSYGYSYANSVDPRDGSLRSTTASPLPSGFVKILNAGASDDPYTSYHGLRTSFAYVNSGDAAGSKVLVRVAVPSGTYSSVQSSVMLYNASTGALVSMIQPFGTASYTYGLFVATGDLDGDGYDDIVVAPSSGASAQVAVISGKSLQVVRTFQPYSASNSYGVRVAIGDVNGDGFPDVITAPGIYYLNAAGSYTYAEVKAYDGLTSMTSGTTPPKQLGANLVPWTATDGITQYAGLSIAAGDVDGDGKAEVIVSQDGVSSFTVSQNVRVFTMNATTGVWSKLTGAIGDFSPGYGACNYYGIRVAAVDLDNDGKANIITSPGYYYAGYCGRGFGIRAFDGSAKQVWEITSGLSSYYSGYNPFNLGAGLQ